MLRDRDVTNAPVDVVDGCDDVSNAGSGHDAQLAHRDAQEATDKGKGTTSSALQAVYRHLQPLREIAPDRRAVHGQLRPIRHISDDARR